MADMENLRKRTAQQLEESRQFALQGFARSVLDIADNLERALDSVPANVLEAAGSWDEGAKDEGAVSADLIAKNLTSLHHGVAMSQKVSSQFAFGMPKSLPGAFSFDHEYE
jgi:hypothetical protein